MPESYRSFFKSLQWTALESILYQLFLVLHQIMLFKNTDAHTYGLIGTFFSLIYLIVTIINFGFDISLSPFFSILTHSKSNFRNIIALQYIPECIIVTLMILVTMLGKIVFSHSSSFFGSLDSWLCILLGMLIVSESIKKVWRMILQLASLNKITTFIELSTIILYITIVWLSYFYGVPLSLYSIFIPMLILSCIGMLILTLFVFQFYNNLPDIHYPLELTLHKRILKNRFFNCLTQLSHTLFSSNFLVPFFAMVFGFANAGILKLLSTITYCITIVLQKVFGISSALLLSHLKNNSMQTKQNAFIIISSHLNQILIGILIFFFINFTSLTFFNNIAHSHVPLTLAYLFFIISFSENFFIAYEKFYINEEKSDHLFLFNSITLLLMCFILYVGSQHFSQLAILVSIIIIRLLAFASITIISFNRWRIKPSFSIQPLFFIGSLAISLLFFVLARI